MLAPQMQGFFFHHHTQLFLSDTIKKKYSVFVPGSWHTSTKTHGISRVLRVSFGLLAANDRMGVGVVQLGSFSMGVGLIKP